MVKILEKRDDGKYKVVINTVVESSEIAPLPLNEDTQQIEVGGSNQKCIAAYRVPISRPGKENLNERTYEVGLWENVLKNQQQLWDGAFGLCDHPNDDGSVKDAFCVWRNLHFAEGKELLKADMHLFGRWGQHAEDALQAGGKLGFSTVGFGDFLEESNVIDPDTYVIERPADWVLNPSYEVFGDLKDRIVTQEDVDKAEEDRESLKESTSEPLFIFEGRRKGKRNIMSLEERDFRRKIENAIEDAENQLTIESKLQTYEEVSTYFEGVDYGKDLLEKVEARIEALEGEVVERISKGSKYDETAKTNEELVAELEALKTQHAAVHEENEKIKREFDTSIETLRSVKEYSNNLRRVHKVMKAKTTSMVKPSDYKEVLAYAEDLEGGIEKLKAEVAELSRKVAEKEQELDAIQENNRNASSERRSRVQKERFIERRKAELEAKRMKEQELLEAEREAEEGLDFTQSAEVQSYYEDLYENNTDVELIKDLILTKKTVSEAQMAFLEYRDLIGDGVQTRYVGVDGGDPIFDPKTERHGFRESVNGVLKRPEQRRESQPVVDDDEEDIFS